MTARGSQLFPADVRVCEVCGYSSSRSSRGNRFNRPQRGEVPIISLNVTIYLCRPGQEGQLATARRVRVCENCLVPVLASPAGMHGIKGRVLAQHLFETIRNRYSSICEAKPV